MNNLLRTPNVIEFKTLAKILELGTAYAWEVCPAAEVYLLAHEYIRHVERGGRVELEVTASGCKRLNRARVTNEVGVV